MAHQLMHSLHSDMPLYFAVRSTIANAFENSLKGLENGAKSVVVIVHSLGCKQISNYISDSRKDLRFLKMMTGKQHCNTNFDAYLPANAYCLSELKF